jgi:uncharacterized cupredoxin-like copper-binding protein
MRTTIGTHGRVLRLLTGSVVILAGCGGGSSSSPGVTSSAAASAAASVPAGTSVTASEKEFSITLSQTTFKAGTYTFHVTNAGSFGHNLTIKGPGVDTKATSALQPGQSGTLTVTLQTGSYELWCSVDSHKEQGMDLNITVT